ncbi:uncharacterized protein LOC116160090 [Photinus pyralis]|uniref:uncharacterized protein LOC116160090 n=1 Tax=Photinus pyralis TaxID=7054 RepID=UPI001266F2F1|nr:uncharacterized protein LOC116160090 [Photinus pyralis]
MKNVPCYEYVIPLRKVLQSFFSLESVLLETLQYIKKLNSQEGYIGNFIQGSFWKSRVSRYGNRVVLPLFLFFDDFETGNVLGSRSGVHKLGAMYVSVPCLPPWQVSVLSNIFLALFIASLYANSTLPRGITQTVVGGFHSSDRVSFGNRVIFQPLIDEFNYLSENGIDLEVPGFKGTIYFELGLILGDNLGIHSLIGFVESFSSNFPCRVCKVKKEVMWSQCREDTSLLRNISNYNADLIASNPSNSGIKEMCVWLDVKGFDLFQQVGCDVMHDVLEGVGKYVVSFVLTELTTKKKYFSLENFNKKLSTFSYGPDAKNKPFQLSREHLMAGNIRLSASEMLTLIRYLPLLVGHEVPREDQVWKLYLSLRQVVEILLSPILLNGTALYLQTLVDELNEIYLEVTKTKLKPKFHNLVHYHSAISKYGPVVHLWSMRFEAKHRLSKMAARASSNRINITLSLAMKQQLALNEIFMKGKLSNVLSTGPKHNDLSLFDKVFLTRELSLDNSKLLQRINWAAMSSVRYDKGCILVYDSKPQGDYDDVIFTVVDKLYLYDSTQLIISGVTLDTIEFDDHLCTFKVKRPHIDNNIAIFYDSLPSQTPHTLNIHSDGNYYVTLRSPL